jgi:hypothetical protein
MRLMGITSWHMSERKDSCALSQDERHPLLNPLYVVAIIVMNRVYKGTSGSFLFFHLLLALGNMPSTASSNPTPSEFPDGLISTHTQSFGYIFPPHPHTSTFVQYGKYHAVSYLPDYIQQEPTNDMTVCVWLGPGDDYYTTSRVLCPIDKLFQSRFCWLGGPALPRPSKERRATPW